MKRLVCCLLAFLVLLCGCGGEGETKETLAAGYCYIYYENTAATALVSQVYQYSKETAKEQAEELVAQMRISRNVSQYVPAIPESVKLLDIQIREEEKLAVLNFSAEYYQMKPAEEVLCRAALVKTVAQVPGVEQVSIQVESQPLAFGDQEVVGNMTADSFVDSTWKDIKSATLKLYFADENKENLVVEEREVLYSGTVSMERYVVEQLIEGPSAAGGLTATMPKETQILSLSTRDSVCYLNLSKEFTENALDLSGYLSVYSIVNSLTDLSGISKVQITVEGNSRVSLKEMSLEQPLERDLRYVKTE